MYNEIARYYDLLMDSGYYNHEYLAKTIQSLIGQSKKILELGIGTGLLAQEMLKRDYSYSITGVDLSPGMLEIAKKRLPNQVRLLECDVVDMKLEHKFDIAISSGGTWGIIQSDNESLLGTHLPNYQKDVGGLQNVADHLVPGGLLLLSVQPLHKDCDINLADGITYSQRVENKSHTSEKLSLRKSYCFKLKEKILAQEMLNLVFYKSSVFPKMLVDTGFEPLGLTDSGDLYICKKRG